jgi:hypothetical protein
MASMSYCRWENTVQDFSSCLEDLSDKLSEGMSLEEYAEDLSSRQEKNAFWRMVRLVSEMENTIQRNKDD